MHDYDQRYHLSVNDKKKDYPIVILVTFLRILKTLKCHFSHSGLKGRWYIWLPLLPATPNKKETKSGLFLKENTS